MGRTAPGRDAGGRVDSSVCDTGTINTTPVESLILSMKSIDEQRLESDLPYRYEYVSDFIGFDTDDVASLHAVAARLLPLVKNRARLLPNRSSSSPIRSTAPAAKTTRPGMAL